MQFRPWSVLTQASEIADFDIGVMPLPRTPHTEGKCAYKALQYMAAGVPPVVSDVGINREVVGECGRVASSLDEFGDHLEALCSSWVLRLQLGEAARQKVERHYSVQVVSAQLAGLLKGL